jgi:hypothetical protein
MDFVRHTIRIFHFFVFILTFSVYSQPCLVPIAAPDRSVTDNLQLTQIGAFAAHRPKRPGIPAHRHTGIDIKRPSMNYFDEPIFPIATGRVISVRRDGPFAQIIVEHEFPDVGRIWSVYEHIAGISCAPGDTVDPFIPIARFMNRPELDQYGFQFDHLHLEILKQPPRPTLPSPQLPDRFFSSYNLICYTEDVLTFYYIDPLQFFEHQASYANTMEEEGIYDENNR